VENSGQALTSWKDIAQHLGVAVRTAQHWERERGLPVRHFPGVKGRVTAEAAELDRWVVASSVKAEAGGKRRALGYVALAAVATAGVTTGTLLGWKLTAPHPGLLAACRLEGPALVATDAAGKELWRENLPAAREAASYAEEGGRPLALVEDLDGRPGAEILVNYDTVDRLSYPPALICYSGEGEEQWRYLPGRVVTDGYRRFSPAQVINRLLLVPAGREGGRLILVNSHHEESWPDRFVVLDAAGRRVGEYWHAGRLNHVAAADLDGDGTLEALLAGVNEGYQAATLIMFDLREVRGTSWNGDGDPYHLHGIEHGTERRRIVFQRTCVHKAQREGARPEVVSLRVEGNLIRVRIQELPEAPGAEVAYTLDRELRVIACEWSDRLKSLHRSLELEGRLDHPLTQAEMAELRHVRVALSRPEEGR